MIHHQQTIAPVFESFAPRVELYFTQLEQLWEKIYVKCEFYQLQPFANIMTLCLGVVLIILLQEAERAPLFVVMWGVMSVLCVVEILIRKSY